MAGPTQENRRGLTNGTGALLATRGRVNGVRVGATNGRSLGRVNGLTNVHGRVNGLINGNGLVKGSGFVNGLSLRRNPFGIVTQRDLRRGIALVLASLFLVTAVGYFLSEEIAQPDPTFVVDGDFSEWAGVAGYEDDPDPIPDSVDLVSYKVHATKDELFVYGRTRGPLFGGSEASSVYVFLGAPTGDEGYAIPSLSAAFLAELYGWEGAIRGTSFRAWAPGHPDEDNASALVGRGGVEAAVAGTEFEIALARPVFEADPGFRLRIVTSLGDATDSGAVVGSKLGAVVAQTEPLATLITGSASLLRVRLRALGVDVRVDGISYELVGGGTVSAVGLPATIPSEGEAIADLVVDPASVPAGTMLLLRATGVDARTTQDNWPVPVTLTGPPARAYIATAPVGVTVDGLFADWSSTVPNPDDAVRDGLDLVAVGTNVTSLAYFYAETQGDLLTGTILPELRQKASPGGGGGSSAPSTVPLPRLAGEDVLRIYVDTDDQDGAGEPFGEISANRLLEIRGRLGRITSKSLSTWNPGTSSWERQAFPFEVEFSGSRLEASAPLAFLGPRNNPRVGFAMSDWRGSGDMTSGIGLRTRGGLSVDPHDGTNPDTITAPLLTNIPTVDADCSTTVDEYAGSSSDFTSDLVLWVGRRDDNQYVYVCIEVPSDTTSNPLDWGEIVFDTNHDDTATPQDEDRRFRKLSGPTPMVPEKGDGTGWIPCGADCDPGDIAAGGLTDGIEVYEFRIRYSDVWGTNSPTANQDAGFAIVVHDEDAGVNYIWGSDDVDDSVPSTWGVVEIPELSGGAIVLAILATLGVPRLSRHWRSRARTSRQPLNSARRIVRR